MELVNETYDAIGAPAHETARGAVLKEAVESIVILLSPFVPHIGEEMWRMIGKQGSVFRSKWPSYDAAAIVEKIVTIPSGTVKNSWMAR